MLAVGESRYFAPWSVLGRFAVSHAGPPHWVKMAASEWDVCPNLRINLLVRRAGASPQRTCTHPAKQNRSAANRQRGASCTGWARKAVGKAARSSNSTRKGKPYASFTALTCVILLGGCNWLWQCLWRNREANEAIGAGCRQNGPFAGPCFLRHPEADRAQVYAGWRGMNEHDQE